MCPDFFSTHKVSWFRHGPITLPPASLCHPLLPPMSDQETSEPSDSMNGHLGPTWEIALGVILAVVVLTTAAVAIYQVRKRRRQKKESRYVSRRDPEMVETGHGREREPHSPRSHKHRSFSAKSNYHSTRGSPNSSTSHIAAGVTKPPRAARSSLRHDPR